VTVLIKHLDAQIESTRAMLRILLAQTEAIRRQDAESVLARLGEIHQELAQRERLERDRDEILRQAGARLGLDVSAIELDDLLMLIDPAEAGEVRRKSGELKGLLVELARVHGQNRILIRQELAFLDHLMRALSGTPQGGYSPDGRATAGVGLSTLDARA
jgi:hypothetical protein